MKRAALVLLAGLLAGCVSLSGQRPPPDTAGLTALENWAASGRIAVMTNGVGGSGSFTWRQEGTDTQLALRGPLGTGGVEITSDGVHLSVTDASGQAVDEQAQAALRARLGADLPLASLRYWMLGLPDPGAEAQVTESASVPLRVIDQRGWTIAYEAFERENGLDFPSKLTAVSGKVRLKLAVSDWQVPASGPGSGRP